MAEENKHRRAFIEEEVAERRARSEARRAEHHARAEKEGKPCQQCHHPFLPPEIGPPLLWNIKGFCSSGCFHAWELQQHGQDCKICGKRFLMHKLGGTPPWERPGCCSLKCHQVVKSSSGETRAHRPKAQGPARVPGRFYALVAAMALMLLGSLIALSWIWIVVPAQEHAVRVETDFKDAQALIEKTRAALEKGKLEDTRAWLETAFRVLPDDERIQGKTFGQWKAEWRAALGAIVSLKLMDFDKFVRTRVYDVEYVTSLVNALGSDADKIQWKSLREGPSGSE